MGAKKNFVIDTNVILHDYNCLKNFQENDIYLPIVVLEELDKFKKGNEQINFNAREFVRELDLITDDNLFTKGLSGGGVDGVSGSSSCDGSNGSSAGCETLSCGICSVF